MLSFRYVKNNFGEDRDRQSAIDASLALNLREPIKNNVGPGKTHSSPASKGVQSEKEAGGNQAERTSWNYLFMVLMKVCSTQVIT